MGQQANRKIIAIWGALALLAIILIIGGTSFAGEGGISASLAACGPLSQEAENGALHGAMQIGEEDGRQYIYMPQGASPSKDKPHPDNRVDYCMTVPQSGTYLVSGVVSAENDKGDSFWVVINGKSYLWDTGFGHGFNEMLIADRQNDNEPVLLELPSGQVKISVHLREAGSKLDKIELLQVGSSLEPTPTPEGFEYQCGPLFQEAEHGTMVGKMQIGDRQDASGGRFIFVPDSAGEASKSPDWENRADFCVRIPEDGKYQIRAAADVVDGGRDSMVVTIDGAPSSGFLWQPRNGNGFIEDMVHDRGINETQIIYLTKGDHTFTFHHREPRTMLDWFEVEPAAEVEIVPTEPAATEVVPTATNIPVIATATPEEEACGSLIIEAERGKLFGNFKIGTHQDASGGQYIAVPESEGNALGGKIDPKNRAEYCVNIDQPGEYQIMAWARTPKFHESDSFYLTIDGQPSAGIVWDVRDSDTFVNSYVNAVGISERLSINLAAGEHTITFHRREADTQLDRFELIFISESSQPAPTKVPTKVPTKQPTVASTKVPTQQPTKVPTKQPTKVPTQVPTKVATQVPTSAAPTATPISSACSTNLTMEAERGEIKGAFQVRNFLGASGSQYIYVPENGQNVPGEELNEAHSVTFCVNVSDPGTYKILARTWAPDVNHDTFYVRVDGAPSEGFLWDVTQSTTFVNDYVNDRFKSDPTEIFLTAGDHTITVYHREPGVMLDKIELENIGNGGAPINPTATPITLPPTATPKATAIPPTPTATKVPATLVPTATAVPPTATATIQPESTLESCGSVNQEAENGQLFGRMQVVNDSSASGGRAIGGYTDLSQMSTADRVDYCVLIMLPGHYQIIGHAKSPDTGSNSMFWTVDGTPGNGMIWHADLTKEYRAQNVSDGGNVEGGNSSKSVYLSTGKHTISFYLRETEMLLDRFEIVSANGGGGVIPQPTSTSIPATTVPATATPVPTNPGNPGGGGSLGNMVPKQAQIDYSNAGLHGGIPNYTNIIEVTGRTQDDIQRAIDSAAPYTKIILPPGVINIGQINITKRNIVISGSGNGCGETILRIGSQDSAFFIGRGGYTNSSINLSTSAYRNSKQVTLTDASSINVGDYVVIRQNDSSDYFRADLSRNANEDWTRNNAQQMNKVVARNGNTLSLEGGLNLDYTTALNARVAKVNNVISGVGIENLTIERTVDDGAQYESANIYFKYAAYSWVKGVHSKNSVRAHITMNKSYKSEIRGNYLHASFNNGGGGHGYGVRLEGGTTDVLVENNIAKLMRHSYIAQIGANGNVFGYNYSTDPYGEGFGEIFTDLSVHGGFGHSNLFEGNQAQHAKVDNIHGSNSNNVFFRNRLEQDIDNYTYKNQLMSKGASTPHIWVHENQYYNAFVANEIGFPGANSATQTVGFDSSRRRDNFTVCKYETSSDGERGCGRTRETTVNHGTHDYLTGQTTWDSSVSSRSFPNSVYLNGKPSFWGSSAWPSFGPDRLGLSENDKMIPAKARFIDAQNGRGSYCYSGN